MKKNGDERLYSLLNELDIDFEYIEHPPAPTIEIAKQYWQGHDAQHCKNLFFRNHKGNQHYLVVLNCDRDMNIHEIEKQLKQGKLSFASEKRLLKYLGLTPGSVTPFGLINDTEKHVYVFLDHTLDNVEKLSFHPCINTASLIIKKEDFLRFLNHVGNSYEWIKLY
ncbi:prolyl-tRNA synthetase associated domain-containing protein [Bacteroidales bacterium OttesenSCG-928-B11]|nr:prolyl-tRNA synthetase associated domain-containing protein [Bacteroidales bacterium OttesenSCG-928-C03]MDL2311862.1 prolyl-tRNA synthetase associated domain-containing protein [Bacteroidales bacterium OttesenSCG-928-B11]MDL2326528.1 prolyl-tRNA synthetase associated domain-containing protein [Bacteroidales bacterium OttesenSCG-928-A14]